MDDGHAAVQVDEVQRFTGLDVDARVRLLLDEFGLLALGRHEDRFDLGKTRRHAGDAAVDVIAAAQPSQQTHENSLSGVADTIRYRP
ncbi:hypothetical protein [Stackebrandtia nassauensis]|uniref:hypothetical protein n=1 Tax=Stackebrandtia nassauensis TaxID=283811 RepID=UPI0001A3949B|nr:hypothetical protein [Stackebrandtia nassauensis]